MKENDPDFRSHLFSLRYCTIGFTWNSPHTETILVIYNGLEKRIILSR